MGLFSRRPADFLTSPQKRDVLDRVLAKIQKVQCKSIRGTIVDALKEAGFGHMGLGSATERELAGLIGQGCDLVHATPERIEEHCKGLPAAKLESAVRRAHGWA